MKNLLILLIFSSHVCLGQQNFERKVYIEINERADFYDVDNRYHLRSDTVFYSKAGFLINPEYAIHKTGDKEYVILTYPKYRNGSQYQDESLHVIISQLDEIRKSLGKSDIDSIGKADLEQRIINIEKKLLFKSKLNIDSISKNGFRYPIHPVDKESYTGRNNRILMIEKTKFDNLSKTTLYDTKWVKKGKWYKNLLPEWRNYKITTGLLTVPFKLRPKQDMLNFNITTDVTLGPYFGISKRISKKDPFYLTLPATLGLSFININNNTTTNMPVDEEIGIVPGITWSTGFIFQFDKFNIGFLLGKDYASGIGDQWIYQDKMWYSFAIGYSFTKPDEK